MIYLNLKTSTLRAPEYIGSEPTQRGTWLNLMCYCCEQENGGVIDGCAGWKDRQWQQTAGVTLAEVREDCDLWKWDGEALVVTFYPSDKEAEVRGKREAGKRGGSARTQAKTQAARINGAKHNPSTTQAQPKQEPNGKERKGIGKEGERNDSNIESGEVWQEPSRAQVIEAARNCGLTEQQADIWLNETLARPIDPFGRWTDRNGRPIGSWQHALGAWAGRFKENNNKKGTTTHASNSNGGRERVRRYHGVNDPAHY
jgi:hypothetical protein